MIIKNGKNTASFIDKAKVVGLVVNKQKTKVMESLENKMEVLRVEGMVFEKV